MSAVSDAADVTRDHPDRVVLLGIFPDRPEAGYGWIEPAEPLASHATRAVYAVRRFWEEPAPAVTERLREAGAFWNSFDLFRPLAIAHGSRAVADAVYAVVAPVDFSRDVLQAQPDALAVLPVSGVEWNDLGDPERVRATRRQVDWMPGTA